MRCNNCNNDVPAGMPYCPVCGAPVAMQQAPMMPPPPVKRSNQNSKFVVIAAILGVIILALIVVLVIVMTKDKTEPSGDKTETQESVQEEVVNTEEKAYETNTYRSTIDEHQYDWLSERKVTAADLAGKPVGELRLMRNAIWAKHGYIFKSADLAEYFANFSWYKPTRSDVGSYLSMIENANVEFISKYEGVGKTPTSNAAPAKTQASSGLIRNIGYHDDYSVLACNTRLTDADVCGLSKEELRILRNTIYARHGRKFKDKKLAAYFSQFSWYEPRYNEVSNSVLSATERHNIALIQKYE